MDKIKFLDVFSGIGGFHLAFKRALPDKELECVGAIEIDNQCKTIYSKNFNYKKTYLNIKQALQFDYGEYDWLFAGFPCISFSIMGKRRGLDDENGKTLLDLMTLIERDKPNFILLENVPNFYHYKDGKVYYDLIKHLNINGYITPDNPLIISPLAFGVPHNRKRLYIPAIKRELVNDETVFQEKFSHMLYSNDVNNSPKLPDYIKQFKKPKTKNVKIRNLNQRHKDILNAYCELIPKLKRDDNKVLGVVYFSPMLNNDWSDLNSTKTYVKRYVKNSQYIYQLNKQIIDEWMKKHRIWEWTNRLRKLEWYNGYFSDLKESLIQIRQSGIRVRKNDTSFTLTSTEQSPVFWDKELKDWRYIYDYEALLLQSFPSDFYISNISQSKILRMCGNSVNVEVVKHIIKTMYDIINEYESI